jgi:hypothetical protein
MPANPMAFIHISSDRKLNAYNRIARLLGGGENCLPGYFSVRIGEKAIYKIQQYRLEAVLKIKGVTEAKWTGNYRGGT